MTARKKKRTRRTKAQIEQLRCQIYEELKADNPQSIRHTFYRMTNPRLPEPVEKTQRGYRQIQLQLSNMRRDKIIPYGWISDSSRRGWHVVTHRDASDFLRNMAGLYRADIWSGCGAYVEVWCESRSIAGVIEPDCREMAVSLYPCGGFTSWTLPYEAAQAINHETDYGLKTAEIIYVGDYDPAGVLVDKSLLKQLKLHLAPDIEINFRRVGINHDQIQKYNLPTKVRKPGERRSPHIKETVEAEAMPAHIMRRLVRDAVESFLPPDALRIAKIVEESERASLREWADLISGGAP